MYCMQVRILQTGVMRPFTSVECVPFSEDAGTEAETNAASIAYLARLFSGDAHGWIMQARTASACCRCLACPAGMAHIKLAQILIPLMPGDSLAEPACSKPCCTSPQPCSMHADAQAIHCRTAARSPCCWMGAAWACPLLALPQLPCCPGEPLHGSA